MVEPRLAQVEPPGLVQAESDEFWMAEALKMAEFARQQGEIPVGAVLVKDGQLVSSGYNQSIRLNDPTAHAEVMALRAAGQILQNYRLIDTTLYVTLEPCAMCSTAMVHARVKRLVFGAPDPKTGSAGSVINLVQFDKFNHQVELKGGVLEAICSAGLSAFFKTRREQKRQQKSQSPSVISSQKNDFSN